MSPLLTLNRLKKWRRCHALIADAVDAIGDCFAPTFFLSVSLIIIVSIETFVKADCLCFTVDIRTVANYFFFSQFIFDFSLICGPVDQLQFKVK